MKSQAPSIFLLSLFSLSFSFVKSAEPTLNPRDPRFFYWSPAREGDSRSACPGLNTLANHRFLPHNGQDVDAVEVVRSCFEGFGMSPEVCAILVLKGLEDAQLPENTTFSLHDTDRSSWAIRHTRSLSRVDLLPGGEDFPPAETSSFSMQTWQVALRVMEKCTRHVGADCLGRARAARIKDGNIHEPTTNYDMAAAGHGTVESAMIMLTLGHRNYTRLEYIRSVFENERFPVNIGWRPTPFSGAIDDILNVAVMTQKPAKILRCTSNGRVASRLDIIRILESNSPGFTKEVAKLILKAGFKKQSIFDALHRIEEEMEHGANQQDSQSECDVIS